MSLDEYKELLRRIERTHQAHYEQAVAALSQQLVATYWAVGRDIVEYEQRGLANAPYGSELLLQLSRDLLVRLGKGYSRSNVTRMRQFYRSYPELTAIPAELSWSHLVELLKIEDPLERSFYERQVIVERWSTTELIRQKNSSLFLRLAASRDREEILALAKRGQLIQSPDDLIREPYVLDFLKIPEPHNVSERELETRLIRHLEEFLLELGKGFAFIGRQYRITLANRHFYVDLVFYHRILKCFVLLDLKKGEATHQDVGQMNMYLSYFEKEESTEGDNPPIGIVLARDKDDILVEYALNNINAQLFVSKYQLYLPDREELRKLVEGKLHP